MSPILQRFNCSQVCLDFWTHLRSCRIGIFQA